MESSVDYDRVRKEVKTLCGAFTPQAKPFVDIVFHVRDVLVVRFSGHFRDRVRDRVRGPCSWTVFVDRVRGYTVKLILNRVKKFKFVKLQEL